MLLCRVGFFKLSCCRETEDSGVLLDLKVYKELKVLLVPRDRQVQLDLQDQP